MTAVTFPGRPELLGTYVPVLAFKRLMRSAVGGCVDRRADASADKCCCGLKMIRRCVPRFYPGCTDRTMAEPLSRAADPAATTPGIQAVISSFSGPVLQAKSDRSCSPASLSDVSWMSNEKGSAAPRPPRRGGRFARGHESPRRQALRAADRPAGGFGSAWETGRGPAGARDTDEGRRQSDSGTTDDTDPFPERGGTGIDVRSRTPGAVRNGRAPEATAEGNGRPSGARPRSARGRPSPSSSPRPAPSSPISPPSRPARTPST
jgi:hypothetical protein